MAYNINSIDHNEARKLEKMRMFLEFASKDELLRVEFSHKLQQLQRVMNRINFLTQPLLEINVYSDGLILPPSENNPTW